MCLKNNHVFMKRNPNLSPNACAHELYQAYRCGTANASWQGQQTSTVSWMLFFRLLCRVDEVSKTKHDHWAVFTSLKKGHYNELFRRHIFLPP